jgi:chitin synthase
MNNYQISALSVGLSIVFVTLLLLVYIKFFKNIYNSSFNKKISFNVKKWFYILFIFAINAAGCYLVYYTRNLNILFFMILSLKLKDIIGSLLFVFTIAFKNEGDTNTTNTTDEESGHKCNIVAFIPVYKESEEQLLKTINSVMSNKGNQYLMLCIVSEGATVYKLETIFDVVLFTHRSSYNSWKGDLLYANVYYGKKSNIDVILIVKESRMGKKDSIIMCNDIFNSKRANISYKSDDFSKFIRDNINEFFNVQSFDYMFCTDADTVLSDNTLLCLSNSIKSKNAIASCGIVNTIDTMKNKSISVKLISNLQNYQYLYGQYLRRTNEDLVNQVLCLPGCISMFKLNLKTSGKALEMFSELPDTNNMISSTVQLVGTDRRYTSCLIQNNKNAKIVLDKRCHAYTVPPSDFSLYVSQRRRWSSNMYFNGLVNIFAPNINIMLRFFNLLDYLRLSLVYFRLFNTVYFIYLISMSNTYVSIIRFIPVIVIVMFPTFCFFIYSLFVSHLRKNYFTFLLMYLLNKVFTLISSVIIMIVMLFNIGNFNWDVKTDKVDKDKNVIIDNVVDDNAVVDNVDEHVVDEHVVVDNAVVDNVVLDETNMDETNDETNTASTQS